jgi:hypothetical protein
MRIVGIGQADITGFGCLQVEQDALVVDAVFE